MTAFPRRLSAAVCTVLLAAGGVATTAAPASATVTTLCVGYTGCARLGMSDSGYSKASSTMYWRMYSGHNCTNYAAYRMVRSGLPNSRPWTGSGNATNWGSAMSRITNGTPSVGAVAWWRAGVYPAGSAGHVAYVEKVVSADEIIVSMDSWRGDFSWARITRASRGWPSGFVHFNDVHLASRTLPTVTGSPKVGSTLTATPGTWSVAGTSYAYQWLADGSPISGATSSTFTATQALKGKRLSVKVTASAPGYPAASAVSAATAAVQPGVITNIAPPTISGDPRVDSALTVQPGTWDPATAAFDYQWRADGAPIPDATGTSLALDPSLVGKAISVEVTATQTGYTAVTSVSAATSPVAPGEMPATTPPSVSGQAVPGGSLQLGSFSVDPAATTSVRWMRGLDRVPGAASSSYRVSTADLGHRMRAIIIVKRAGYRQQVLRTHWTRVVKATPVLRVTTVPGVGRLAFRATVRAAGVAPIDGTLVVRSRGKVLSTVRVSDGAASGTITALPPGSRIFRFRVPATATTDPGAVVRRLRIG